MTRYRLHDVAYTHIITHIITLTQSRLHGVCYVDQVKATRYRLHDVAYAHTITLTQCMLHQLGQSDALSLT